MCLGLTWSQKRTQVYYVLVFFYCTYKLDMFGEKRLTLRWLKIVSIIHREETNVCPQIEKITVTDLSSQGLTAADEKFVFYEF